MATTPRWVLVYATLMLLVSVNTAVLGYAAPELLFDESVPDFANAAPITHFYATRNAALAVLGGAALLTRSRPLLFAAMLTRLVVDSVDLGFTLEHRIVDAPPAFVTLAWLVGFTVPQLACLWQLRDGATGRGWRFQIEELVDVSADAERIWAKLTRHESMPTWVTLGLRGVRLQANGSASVGTPGSYRVIRFAGWPEVTERFVEVEAPVRYSYEVIAGMPHLREHLGVVSVEKEAGSSRIRWTITFVFEPLHPLSWMSPLFVAGFRRVVARGLRELKRQVESESAQA
ncbi:MAG: SRPBCC family protein [Nannocystales bacterium]